MALDVWFQSILVEVVKEASKYLVFKQLKPKLEEKIPPEKREEFRNRLTEATARLNLKDTVVLKLRDYPGLLPYLKDEEFRKKYLRVDAGSGVVVLDSKAQSIVDQSNMSYGVLQYKMLRMLDSLHREMFMGSFTASLPGTVRETVGRLAPEASAKVGELTREFYDKDLELERQKEQVLNLEFPIDRIEDSIRNLLEKFAERFRAYVEAYIKLLEPVLERLPSDRKNELLRVTENLLVRLQAYTTIFDGLCRIYDVEMTGQYHWVYSTLEQLTNLITKLRLNTERQG